MLLRLNIEEDDFSALVHHDHGIRGGLQQTAISRFRLLPFAEIAADLGKPAKRAGRVAQRREGDSCQELRAVFSNADALFFVSTDCGSYPEDLLRPALLDVSRGKEAGKVAANNLLGAVTLDSFSAGTSGDDLALRIQHEDRVVLDTVEEHAIFFFALSQ